MTDPFSTATVVPFQLPEQMRAFAEKGVSQARDNYAKFKDAAESHNGTIEAFFGAAGKGMNDYTTKLLGFFQANTAAGFDFMQELAGVKSLPEAGEIITTHTRKQVEVLTSQTKELFELVQKIATETAEPIKASAAKVYNSTVAQ